MAGGTNRINLHAPHEKCDLHVYDGKLHLLPQTWRFPSGAGPLDMWLQRWLGDFINGMGQMRSILQCANPSLAAALLPPIQDEHPKPFLT